MCAQGAWPRLTKAILEPVILALSSRSWYKFASPAARSRQYIISSHRFIWEVGSAATSVQARVTRVLASNSLRCPRAPSSSASQRQVAALAARVRSIARHVERRAGLLSPSLLSPPFAVPSGCWRAAALCTNGPCARHFCVWLCSVWWAGGWC